MRNSIVLSIFAACLAFTVSSSASIDVSRANSPITNDPLVTYQWGLRTSGQALFRDIDDIHTERIDAVAGQYRDIGLTNTPSALDKLMKRDVVVAVVDSGIDFDHEDIHANLFLNNAECDSGRIPFKPEADKDGNGYKGDCAGWNFTANGAEGDNRTGDDLGHGTHVAGIIGAVSSNGVGVSGVSNRIRLLPLKVTYICDEQPREQDCPKLIKKHAPLATRILKAMQYAMKMKVDVINFSMGWPISQDTQALRDAFKAARAQGILVVAAAGNNTSNAPIFPCSYEGVICVGATSINGQVANFSNFGGHVDFFAPGEEILSTIPNAVESMQFSVKGYEIKNGTSQAAPYITAQLSVLRGANPNASVDELIGRMHASERMLVDSNKFGVGGIPHLGAALAANGQGVVRPIFKSLNQVNYSHKTRKFKFDLPIKNYWGTSGSVEVKLSLGSPALRLATSSFQLGSISAGSSKVISVQGDVVDITSTKDVMLQVDILSSGRQQSFKQRITLTRQVTNDLEVQDFALRTTRSQEIGHVSTIYVADDASVDPEYYTANADEAGIHVRILRRSGSQFGELPEIVIPGAKVLKFVMKADLNYDGNLDYMLITFTQLSASKGVITYSYLRSDLQGLFGSGSYLQNPIEGAIISDDSLKNLILMPMTTPFGRIAVPVFRAEGIAPKADLNPDPFEFEENIKRLRLYYLAPSGTAQGTEILTRNFDNYAFDQKVRAQLGINDRPAVKLIDLVPQGKTERQRGEMRAILTVEDERGVQTFELKISADQLAKHEFTLRRLNVGDLRIEGGQLSPVLGLNQNRTSEETSIVSFFTPTIARLAIMDSNSRITHQQKAQPARAQDHLLGHIASYRSGDQVYGVYQTKSQLNVQVSESGHEVRFQADIDRCSFVPGRVFNSSFSPIRVNQGGVQMPAIYVDTTPLTALRIHTWTVTPRGLTAPMYLNLEIPVGCRAMTPQRFGGAQDYSYVLLCKDAAGLKLKTLPIR